MCTIPSELTAMDDKLTRAFAISAGEGPAGLRTAWQRGQPTLREVASP
jgi:hypothetical protein